MSKHQTEVKVRLDPDLAQDLQVWLRSGTVPVSFKSVMSMLAEELHKISHGDCTVEVLATEIPAAALRAHARVEQKKAGRD
jgi:hypothetical protein